MTYVVFLSLPSQSDVREFVFTSRTAALRFCRPYRSPARGVLSRLMAGEQVPGWTRGSSLLLSACKPALLLRNNRSLMADAHFARVGVAQ